MTPKQNEIYQYLWERRNNPVSPSFEEMVKALGLSSKAGVHRLLEALEEQRLITRQRGKARRIKVHAIDGNPLVMASLDELCAEVVRRGFLVVPMARAA